jgi:hypothetical protein
MPGRFNADNYVDVQERINRFWQEYPDGAIRTKLMSMPDDFDRCRYEAAVYKQRDYLQPDATGYAFELAGGGGANSTSHEENCETSAIGRALANMGYATKREDRPSRQEMQKVDRMGGSTQPAPTNAQRPAQQSTTPSSDRTPGGASVKSLNLSLVLSQELGISDDDVHRWTAEQFGKTSRKDLDQRQMSKLIDWLKSLQASGAAKPTQPAQSAQMTALSGDIEESGEIVDWTRFWVIARADGYQGKDDIKKRLGFDISGMTPQQALDALREVTAQPA